MISNKCYYALRAVLELAKQHGRGPITISEIARIQGIPPRFLEAILRELKQQGITESTRGKEGGYHLSRPPAEIAVDEILRHFEGEPISVNPDARTEGEGRDVFDAVWEKADQALGQVLAATDFGHLVLEDRAIQSFGAPTYSI